MAYSNAIGWSTKIDEKSDPIALKALAKLYYTDAGKLRTGGKLFAAGLLTKDKEFFEPYLKKIIDGPLVTPAGLFIPENQRKRPTQKIDINLTNKKKDDIEFWKRSTTPDPRWAATTSTQPTPQGMPSQPPPPPPPQPQPSTLNFALNPLNATQIAPRAQQPPQTNPTPIQASPNYDVLDNILTDLRQNNTKVYGNQSDLDYNTSGSKKQEIIDFLNIIQRSDMSQIYRLVLNQDYNPNLDIISILLRMYPENDVSHGVCFRPVYEFPNQKYEYACEKFIYLFIFHAKKSIKISTFQFTQPNLAFALAAAKYYNNVDIEIIANPLQMSQYTTFPKVHAIGINLYINCYAKNPILHHDKYLIFDDKILVTGSYNLSANANKNFENYIVVANSPIIESYKQRFDSIKKLGTVYDPPNFGDYAIKCDN